MSRELPELVAAYLQRTLIEQAQPLSIQFDSDWRILGHNGEPTRYGFESFTAAADLAQTLFLGFSTDEIQCLQFVELNTTAAHVHLVPDANSHHVIWLDAHSETERQREVQQIGHQAELESVQKQRAMQRLRAARNELEGQRKQLEEANALKSAFMATLSHEFRAPLTSIFGYLHLLERKEFDDADVKQNIRAIHRGALHLFGLAENLLEFGRGESGSIQLNPVRINLRELADDMHAMFRPLAEAQRLEFVAAAEVRSSKTLLLDEVKLKQVLINLISNAIRYTQVGKVQTQLIWDGERLLLDVIDSGIGIPLDKQDAIFKPFNRGGHQGSKGAGLGLSIVKRLVEAMHGTIELKSQIGTGTTFSVILPPLEKGARVADQSVTIESPLPAIDFHEGIAALIADDDPDIRDLLRLLLEDLGYRTILASNAQEAFDAAMREQPALTVIDVQMPGANGNTAVYRLRSHGYIGRIVMLSADPNAEARAASLQAGANLYLTKPIQLEQFARLLRPKKA